MRKQVLTHALYTHTRYTCACTYTDAHPYTIEPSSAHPAPSAQQRHRLSQPGRRGVPATGSKTFTRDPQIRPALKLQLPPNATDRIPLLLLCARWASFACSHACKRWGGKGSM